jgi:hypothetical protein
MARFWFHIKLNSTLASPIPTYLAHHSGTHSYGPHMAQVHLLGALWLSLGLHLIASVLLLVALGFMIYASVRFSAKEDAAYAAVGDPLEHKL